MRADESQSLKTQSDISYDGALGGKTSTLTHMYPVLQVFRFRLCLFVNKASIRLSTSIHTFVKTIWNDRRNT